MLIRGAATHPNLHHTMNSRPNFLLFVTDQQRADHVGYAGNSKVHTPNLDAIASAGTWWSRFYTASPTCMSNRASLMTGRMPSSHGVRYNGVPLDLDSVTFVDLLRHAGYRTAMVGKSHLQGLSDEASKVPRTQYDDRLAAPPQELGEARRSRFGPHDYRDETISDWKNNLESASQTRLPYYGFDAVAFCLGHGDKMSGHYVEWLQRNGHTLQAGQQNSIAVGSTDAPQLYKPHTPVELYPTTFVGERTIEMLEEFASGSDPFFLKCSFPDPHHPFTPPGKYWDMFDPDDMELPRSFSQPGKGAVPPLRMLWNDYEDGVEPERFSYPFVTSQQQAREIIAKTFGQIAMIDDAMGAVIASLTELGLADNTVICFLSDHGEYLGDHGMFLKGPLHYQSVIKTPLAWKDPDPKFNSGRIDALASTVDLPVTILARAGLQPFNGVQGGDLFDTSGAPAGRDYVLIEQTTQYPHLGFDDVVAVHTYVDTRWRLSVWQGCEWGEFYDLENDPDELENLWDSHEHESTKLRLLIRLVQGIQDHAETSPYPLSVS